MLKNICGIHDLSSFWPRLYLADIYEFTVEKQADIVRQSDGEFLYPGEPLIIVLYQYSMVMPARTRFFT